MKGHFVQPYYLLLVTLHVIILSSTNITNPVPPRVNMITMNGCIIDANQGLRGWKIRCLGKDIVDRVPNGLSHFSSSITSITIRNQPRLRRLHQSDVEEYKRIRKFILSQSGLTWIERKAFIKNRELELVDLRGNALTSVDWRSMVGLARATLDVRQNPFQCNCSLFWMAAWKTRVTRSREIVSPTGSVFNLSVAYLMTLPAEIVDVDRLECVNSSSDSMKIVEWAAVDQAENLEATCSLPSVKLTPRRISTVEGISKSIHLSCEIESSQALDRDFRDMMQLRIVDGNETRSSVRLEKEWRKDGLTINVSTENVTRGLMGWYMCTAVSDAGPEFDITSVAVESTPQIRFTASEVTTSEIGQLTEKFQFIIISFPPIERVEWLKDAAPFNVHDDALAAAFTVTREFETGARRRAFFYGERIALTVRLIFTYQFYEGDYSVRVCNRYGCDTMQFVSYRNKSWFDYHSEGISGVGPVGGVADRDPPASEITEIAWIIAGACIGCGLAICGAGLGIRWMRKSRRPSERKDAVKDFDHERHSFRLNSYTCNSLYEPLLSGNVPVVPLASLRIAEKLGEGAFGEVYLAYCPLAPTDSSTGSSGEEQKTAVAAKRMKSNTDTKFSQDIVREAEFMAKMNHANVVSFYGLCLQARDGILLLYEYMDLGDLKRFLASHGPNLELVDAPKDNWRLTPAQQVDIAGQVAQGLAYLHQRHFVHRDLASRNCLVKSPLTVKLSDFGLTRDIYFSDYYRLTHTAQLPVRWLPPESLCYGRFSDMSDIWSYGIVVWEIASFGEQPWRGHTNMEVIQKIGTGEVLTPPDDCPQVLRDVMLDCWKRVPSERVKMKDVISRLSVDSVQINRP